MEILIKKYETKLTDQGLCDAGTPLLGCIDADILWNRSDPLLDVLSCIIDRMNITSLLYAPPAQPYDAIITQLTEGMGEGDVLKPEDSETRTFLHDIPVIRELNVESIIPFLKKRKGVVIPGKGIITTGTVSPEQAFVNYSSICFSLFVKFFTDLLLPGSTLREKPENTHIINETVHSYRGILNNAHNSMLSRGPFKSPDEVHTAIIEAGRLTVEHRLVDSYFGNISYRFGDTIYISQTGSSLDDLAGCIDPCPMDNSSYAGITASSELSAHREIYSCTDRLSVLHGHPRFSVIMSMACEKKGRCETAPLCYRACPEQRSIRDIPIVPGEVGTGPYGLCTTMPPAIAGRRGTIVYGHGLFTTGAEDFTDAFAHLLSIELMCMDEYLSKSHHY